jgi:hypothetical protein
MILRSIVTSLFVSTVAALSLAACSGAPEASTEAESAEATTQAIGLTCASVDCMFPKTCQMQNGRPVCVGPKACVQNVFCVKGSHYDNTPGVCRCVADPKPQCTVDADCHVEDDYCGGCHCDALPNGQHVSACKGNTVECFVAPCLNKVAACVNGACVASSGAAL